MRDMLTYILAHMLSDLHVPFAWLIACKCSIVVTELVLATNPGFSHWRAFHDQLIGPGRHFIDCHSLLHLLAPPINRCLACCIDRLEDPRNCDTNFCCTVQLKGIFDLGIEAFNSLCAFDSKRCDRMSKAKSKASLILPNVGHVFGGIWILFSQRFLVLFELLLIALEANNLKPIIDERFNVFGSDHFQQIVANVHLEVEDASKMKYMCHFRSNRGIHCSIAVCEDCFDAAPSLGANDSTEFHEYPRECFLVLVRSKSDREDNSLMEFVNTANDAHRSTQSGLSTWSCP